jgi:hypothetical protein
LLIIKGKKDIWCGKVWRDLLMYLGLMYYHALICQSLYHISIFSGIHTHKNIWRIENDIVFISRRWDYGTYFIIPFSTSNSTQN